MKPILMKIRNFLITWDGLWAIPASIIMLVFVTGLLLDINPNADVIGIGVLQDVFTAAFRTVIANTMAQIGVAINIFAFFGLTMSEFKLSFNKLTPWQKVFLVGAFHCAYLLAFVLAIP